MSGGDGGAEIPSRKVIHFFRLTSVNISSKMTHMFKKSKSSLWEKLTPVLVFLSIGLAFFVGMLWQKVQNLEKVASTKIEATNQQAEVQKQEISIDTQKEVYSKDVIKFGDADRKVLFIEVSDPSCPFCHIAGGKNPEISTDNFKYVSKGGTYIPPVPEMKKLVDEGKAAYAYIYTSGHGNGEMGTKALYCAFEKNKFWEVHDIIMTNKGYELLNNTIKNDKTKSQLLADFLKSAVNPSEMKTCLDSGKYDDRLQADSTLAGSLGINGTPGFIVNGKIFAGAYSFKEMQPVVDAALGN
ncbi:MAG: DsbA family protein [bacterium]